jgi:flagellar M-ring protein FliF
MADPTTSPASQMRATLTRLTPIQKIALGATALTLVAGTLVLTRSGGGTAMAAAYTGLEPQDAAAVTDELITRNIEYELVDGGRTILVPADQVYDIRVDLSGEGLPATNEGYALLDRQGITTSEFRQRIDYQRALEGELARTLGAIDGVAAATVHLALPEESVFVDEPEQPTASVLVTRSGTASLTSAQVAAMVHLVASSVKGMTPENVTIADSSGAVLSTAGQTGAGGTTGVQSEAAAAVEHEVESSIRSMIGRVTGAEHVAVTVRAELDLTERQATTEFFDSSADDGVVTAERVATEDYTGFDEAGTPGVLGPDGAVVEGVTNGSESTYTKEDTERTFAVNRTVESTTFASGTVTRLHVAVLVDEDAVTEDQRVEIETMVATAAGVDLDRGDQVVVTRLPFDMSNAEAAEEAAAAEAAAAAAAEQASMIRTGVIGFLVLVALLLAYRSTRRARREVSTPIDIGAIRAEPLDELDEAPAALEAPPTPRVDPVLAASRDALDELSTLADRKPEEVAQILQNWLSDEVGSR